MPDDSLAQLRVIWQAAGRPGQAKLRDAAKRKGLNVTVKQAADFVRNQSVAQVFAPPPKSEGKVTAPELDSRWQCDLIDYKAKSQEKNDDYRLILVCVDVFSRFMYVELLKTKEAEEVSDAFRKIPRRARGNATIKGKSRMQVSKKYPPIRGPSSKGPLKTCWRSRGSVTAARNP